MDEWDDLEVNKRVGDKVFFESAFIQSLSDRVDLLRDETNNILRELDSSEFKQQIDEFDLEEFSANTINQIDEVYFEISKFASEIIDFGEYSELFRESRRNAKMALNRDADYIRIAKWRMDQLDSDEETVDYYKINIRIIELCDKAIYVNKSNFDAYKLKGLAMINLEEYEGGINELINALAIEDDLETWLAIGNANRLNGDYEDAISVYNKLVDEDSFEAYKGKANVYFDWGKFEDSNECFKKASSINSLDDESLNTWSSCLENLE